MAYTPQTWKNDSTAPPAGPISKARLDYIESGIQTAAAGADAATAAAAAAQVTADAALAAGGGGGPPTGAAGGSLTGTYPNPTIASIPSAATATTQSAADSTTKLATTAFATTADNLKANLASPTFTGTPSLPTGTTGTTQSAADSTTKLATTAFVTTADNLKANLASPTFTGTPALPTGTTAVTQSAGNNSTKIATTAYADAIAVAGAVAPAAESYTITTNGTTMTAYTGTGTVAATNTDLGALINGLAADRTSFVFGTGVFPWTTKMVLDAFIGVQLRGQGGRQDENKTTVGGGGATQFKWTGTSGQTFTAAGTQGLTLDGIAFQWSSASYVVGDGTDDGIAFMSIEGVDHSTPTRHCLIKNCYFGATGSGKLDTGGPVLDVNKTVNIQIRDSIFVGGTMHLRSHHVNSSDDFANVVSVIGCRFSRNKAPTVAAAGWPSFYGSGISWTFVNCHFEPGAGGPIYLHETNIEPFSGLTYEDCWVGDQSGTPATNPAFITFHGAGLRVVGGHYDFQDGYSLVKTNAATSGILIQGIDADNPSAAGSNGWLNQQSNGATDVAIESVGGYPTTLVSGNSTQSPRTGQAPYKALSAATTLAQSDHGRTFGVDATSGAITITLPAVGAIGCTLTVKKIDSGGNAVTVSRASSATIDGATTVSLATQYKAVTVISNGTNWMIVGQV